MADEAQLAILRQGVEAWNAWRRENPKIRPDLMRADLRDRNLRGIDLRRAWLLHARLSECRLDRADFRDADLRAASLRMASLVDADLRRATLRHTNLSGANIQGADLSGCQIFGAGLWQLQGAPKATLGMRISQSPGARRKAGEPVLIADSLDSAQFLFVLLDNPRITEAFNALNERIVLILGRFAGDNLNRLRWMRQALMAEGRFVPIVFDFDRQPDRSLTETVAGFAHLALFIIADLTDPKSLPQELSFIVPFLPSVPVVPLAPRKAEVYAMFPHFLRYPWVLDIVEYVDRPTLQAHFDGWVVQPALQRAAELRAAYRRLDPAFVAATVASPVDTAAAASTAPATKAPAAKAPRKRARRAAP